MEAVSSRQLPGHINSRVVILGVGYQWLYNGVNFLAFKVGGEAFHPLMLATLRFDIAAILFIPFAAWRWRLYPASLRELAGAALLGPIMLIGSQTLAIWGTHFLPAGVASVLGSAAPVFLALFAWVFLRDTPGKRQLAGIALGLIGLAAMALQSPSGVGFRPIGAIMMLSASALWAAGSLGALRLRLPGDPSISLAAQLLPTGALLTLLVWVTGISESFHPVAVPLRPWGVLAFLIVVSTLIGYAVFLTLNRGASPTLANSFNYVSPVIALVLSAWLLNEPIGWGKLVAAGVTLAGVALMVGGNSNGLLHRARQAVDGSCVWTESDDKRPRLRRDSRSSMMWRRALAVMKRQPATDTQGPGVTHWPSYEIELARMPTHPRLHCELVDVAATQLSRQYAKDSHYA